MEGAPHNNSQEADRQRRREEAQLTVSRFLEALPNMGNAGHGDVFWRSELEVLLEKNTNLQNDLVNEAVNKGIDGMKAYFIEDLYARTQAKQIGNLRIVIEKIIHFQ